MLMFVLCNKSKNVKGVVKEFNQKYFGKILEKMLEAKLKMEEAKLKMDEAQCVMQTNP